MWGIILLLALAAIIYCLVKGPFTKSLVSPALGIFIGVIGLIIAPPLGIIILVLSVIWMILLRR